MEKTMSTNQKATITLLEIFILAIIAALFGVPSAVQPLALAIVTPFIILGIVFVYYCRKGREWSYIGAMILGIAGIILRLIISTQPNLEPTGGLPVAVTVIYIVLGLLLSLKGYESVLEMRA